VVYCIQKSPIIGGAVTYLSAGRVALIFRRSLEYRYPVPNYVASRHKAHVFFDHHIQSRNVCTVEFLEISKVSELISNKAAAKQHFCAGRKYA